MKRAHGRLSKQDLKEDELVNKALQAWAYIEQNYTRILAVLGVVVVVVLIGVYLRYESRRQARVSIDALGEARIALFQGRIDEALAQAQDIIDDYGDGPAVGQALMLQSNVLFGQGRYAESKAAYERYMREYGDEGAAGYGAWSGIAACLEEEGNPRGAGEEYLAYVDRMPESAFAPLALREAARCFEHAGDLDRARAALQQIVDRYSDNRLARVAKAELRQMGAAN
jgi:tetratricopeptide (TPR) repeat protein